MMLAVGFEGILQIRHTENSCPTRALDPLDSTSEPTWRLTVSQNFAENNKDGDEEEEDKGEFQFPCAAQQA